MIVMPVNLGDESLLVIVIEKENHERMRAADPITIESKRRGGLILERIKNPENLSLLIAYEEDDMSLYQLAKNGDPAAMVKYLERGRKWDPQTDGPGNIFSFTKGQNDGR